MAYFLSRKIVVNLPVFQSILYTSLAYLNESLYSINPSPVPPGERRIFVMCPISDADSDFQVCPPSFVVSLYERWDVSRRVRASSGSSAVGNIGRNRGTGWLSPLMSPYFGLADAIHVYIERSGAPAGSDAALLFFPLCAPSPPCP